MEYRILIVGSGAREHAIARSINKTQIDHQIFCIASNKNPGIMNICNELILGDIEDVDFIQNLEIEFEIPIEINQYFYPKFKIFQIMYSDQNKIPYSTKNPIQIYQYFLKVFLIIYIFGEELVCQRLL